MFILKCECGNEVKIKSSSGMLETDKITNIKFVISLDSCVNLKCPECENEIVLY